MGISGNHCADFGGPLPHDDLVFVNRQRLFLRFSVSHMIPPRVGGRAPALPGGSGFDRARMTLDSTVGEAISRPQIHVEK